MLPLPLCSCRRGTPVNLLLADHEVDESGPCLNRYQFPDNTDTVGGLAEHLVERFKLSQPADGLRLSVDTYTLLPDAAVSILRDGDLVTVAATALALPPTAVAGRKRTLPRDSKRPAKKQCTAAQSVLLALKAKPAQSPPGNSEAARSEQANTSADASPVASGACTSACAPLPARCSSLLRRC